MTDMLGGSYLGAVRAALLPEWLSMNGVMMSAEKMSSMASGKSSEVNAEASTSLDMVRTSSNH